MSLPVYESGNVKVWWNGIDLSKGWAEDTFLSIEPISERRSTTFGADGQMGVSQMANRGATITMTFQQTSDTNKKIAKESAAQDKIGGVVPFAPFTVEDKTGGSAHFVARNAVLTEVSGHSFGNAMGEKTWVWTCESYFETDNPQDLIAGITDFLGF